MSILFITSFWFLDDKPESFTNEIETDFEEAVSKLETKLEEYLGDNDVGKKIIKKELAKFDELFAEEPVKHDITYKYNREIIIKISPRIVDLGESDSGETSEEEEQVEGSSTKSEEETSESEARESTDDLTPTEILNSVFNEGAWSLKHHGKTLHVTLDKKKSKELLDIKKETKCVFIVKDGQLQIEVEGEDDQYAMDYKDLDSEYKAVYNLLSKGNSVDKKKKEFLPLKISELEDMFEKNEEESIKFINKQISLAYNDLLDNDDYKKFVIFLKEHSYEQKGDKRFIKKEPKIVVLDSDESTEESSEDDSKESMLSDKQLIQFVDEKFKSIEKDEAKKIFKDMGVLNVLRLSSPIFIVTSGIRLDFFYTKFNKRLDKFIKKIRESTDPQTILLVKFFDESEKIIEDTKSKKSSKEDDKKEKENKSKKEDVKTSIKEDKKENVKDTKKLAELKTSNADPIEEVSKAIYDIIEPVVVTREDFETFSKFQLNKSSININDISEKTKLPKDVVQAITLKFNEYKIQFSDKKEKKSKYSKK